MKNIKMIMKGLPEGSTFEIFGDLIKFKVGRDEHFISFDKINKTLPSAIIWELTR